MSSMEVSKVNRSPSYQVKRNSCSRDLTLKKIAFAFIAAINCGAIIAAYTYIVLYVNLPTKPLVIASFVVGIIGVFAAMRGKTEAARAASGGSASPLLFVTSLMTYLFFGPTEYMYHTMDWTNYADPVVAGKVVEDMESSSFAQFSENYRDRIANLRRYGFITEAQERELKRLEQEYQPLKAEKARLGEAPLGASQRSELAEWRRAVDDKILQIEQAWTELKQKLSNLEK